MGVVVAIDAGTTGVRALAVDEDGHVVDVAYRELTQWFPRPGWVEHDADEIIELVEETLVELVERLSNASETVAAVGITNQRETAVAFDTAQPHTHGRARARAIVWQDRRTADRCRELEAGGHLAVVREQTGLVLDSYFSATKWEWLLGEGGVSTDGDLALGTVDDWVIWRLTGRHATDVTNASRTMCFDIRTGRWSSELCALFGLEERWLGDVVPSSGRVGVISPEVAGGRLTGVPISGIAGDQQAALFGQQCCAPGQAKVTYGTGSFLLLNLGEAVPPPADGLLTTVAWQLGSAPFVYALEGAVFASGSTIQWLRDGLGIIGAAAETGPLAESLSGNDGVYLVPAFTGLGSPWWDPDARGTIVGLTRGSGRAHLARAAVEAMAYQTRDVIDAMQQSGSVELAELRTDGGAAVMDLLLQLQADQCRVPVVRPATTEVTALGAAMLAGLAEGVWTASDLARLPGLTEGEARFEPTSAESKANAEHAGWLRAVEKSRS